MRSLFIQRFPLGQQLIDSRTRICGLQQWSRSVLTRASKNFISARSEVDHQAAVLHALSQLRVQYSATAGGQHNSQTLRQFVQKSNLTPSKARFTFDLENRRNRNATARLQFSIGIDELITQLLREQPADS